MICYDGSADQIYSFTDFEKTIASVESSVRGYFGDDSPELDKACEQVTTRMRELRHAPCIPMMFSNLKVIVYNWEIDASNPIHKTLSDCHETADDDLKLKIETLFGESVH
jgi:hypothetical protein